MTPEPEPDPYASRSFEEFWPHYVRMHARPETQALHAVATLSAIALGGAAVVTRRPLLALAAPLVDYAIAQASHRVYERNVTKPWRHHAWHARAELRMLRLVLTGRMRAETRRLLERRAA
jgi:hypothetical protein